MSSPIQYALKGVTSQPAQPAVTPPVYYAGSFWQEFWRVYFDKCLLVFLILVFHFSHSPDAGKAEAGLIGALLYSIQGQRFNKRS